tara:strand:- start:484 stop:3081 length:2598 start_codon:yes stop_codon:yes gene_type:complete
METNLIYVNKGSAFVKNEDNGEFISEVNSTICKAGDLVSIEGVAISTKGTGADTIEIPNVLKDYRYKTNELQIEFMTYLHDNFKYAVRLPVVNQDQYTSILTDINYGDVLPDEFVIANNQEYVPKNPFWSQTYGGYRYYIGSWGNPGQDPANPTSSTQDNTNVSTGKLVFNFLTTKVPLKVDLGYNTPENITSKVTSDLHSSMFIPQRLNSDIVPLNFYEPNFTNGGGPVLQATCVSENSSVITINGIPKSYPNTSTTWYSTYQNFIAVQQPFYWYWGSRLQAEEPNGCAKQLGYMNATYPTNNLSQADIVTINELRIFIDPVTASQTTYVNTSDVVATNLQFDERTIVRVQKYLHSMKQYKSTIQVTREQMKSNKTSFSTKFLFGKFYDGSTTPYASLAPLPDKMGTGGINSICNNWCQMKTFYNDDVFNSAILPIVQPDINIIDEVLTLSNGVVLSTNKQLCQYYDINIVRIRATGNAVDTIGFIVTGNSIQRLQGNVANRVVVPGSFCLFDSTFSREESQSLLVATTDLRVGGTKNILADVVPGFNIGAPNINLTFNGDRSRFAWSNMYWSSYIGNPDPASANPDADVEAISCNRNTINSFYRPLAPFEVIFTQFAQSGLAFWNFSVRNSSGDWIKIDKSDQNDINEKYTKGNFLSRIGFDFNDLFDDFGIPMAFYQERASFNNTQIKYPQFFPFPLTNNPQVDTAFNISINATDTELPTFNLSLERNVTGINVAAQSSEILARNLPEKLATPFWLIESDILPGVKYSVEGNTRNILGVVNRAYGNGDFVFGFASDYKFIATKAFVISHIKTNILTSDLLPALVDDNTTIIYKIESPILPNFVSEQEAREISAELAQKFQNK